MIEKLDKMQATKKIMQSGQPAYLWQDKESGEFRVFFGGFLDTDIEKEKDDKPGVFADISAVDVLIVTIVSLMCSLLFILLARSPAGAIVGLGAAVAISGFLVVTKQSKHRESLPPLQSYKLDVEKSAIFSVTQEEADFLDSMLAQDGKRFEKLAHALYDANEFNSTAAREFFDRQVQKKEFSRDVEAQVEKAHLEQRAQSAQLKWEIENELDDLR